MALMNHRVALMNLTQLPRFDLRLDAPNKPLFRGMGCLSGQTKSSVRLLLRILVYETTHRVTLAVLRRMEG